MFPDWESNLQLLGLQASAQSTKPHQSGFLPVFLDFNFFNLSTLVLPLTANRINHISRSIFKENIVVLFAPFHLTEINALYSTDIVLEQ